MMINSPSLPQGAQTVARRTALGLLLGCGLLLGAASCQQILGTGDFQDLCKPYGQGDPPNCAPYQQAGTVCTPNEVRECPYSGDPKRRACLPRRLQAMTHGNTGTFMADLPTALFLKAADYFILLLKGELTPEQSDSRFI
jgi:hypothetical protein